MTWARDWRILIWSGLLACSTSCASWGKPRLVILPETAAPIRLKTGDPAPFEAICFQPGSLYRWFEREADAIFHEAK